MTYFGGPLHSSVNKAISNNARFVRDYNAYGPAAFQYDNAYAPQQGDPYAFQYQQMMQYQWGMMMQMQQAMQQLYMVVDLFNQVFPDQSIDIQDLFSTNGPNTGQNRAFSLLRELVDESEGETDNDGDGYAVSQADIEEFKERLDDEEITKADLVAAFQQGLKNAPEEATDEVVVLYAQMVDQGVLDSDIDSFLSPDYLAGLDELRLTSLSRALANSGTVLSNGDVNAQLTGFLLLNVNSRNEDRRDFARQLVIDMIDAWDGDNSDEASRIQTFLADWIGIRFRGDTLEVDDTVEQPFPLT